MLSPNPISLFCVIVLCFYPALVLIITSTSSSIITPSLTLANFISSPPPPTSPPPPPPPPPPPSPPLPKPTSKPPQLTLKNTSSTLPTNETTSKQPLKQLELPSPPPPPPPPPPPLVPEDDKDDTDLLKRASQVDTNTTEGHPKKVAFMFLTVSPLPFAPLWELFFNQSGARSKGQYNVYIHADPKSRYDTPFEGVFSRRVIPSSKPTGRSSPTLIMAARRLLAHALLDDPDNYMFTLLSEACIPLHSFNFTYTTLVSSDKSFIQVLSNETTAHERWAARGEDVMLPEVSLQDFRKGSQFWTLTRQHARMVVEDNKLWRKFRLPCVNMPGHCFPEEHYFPTLLSMVDPQGVVPATLTNVNWRGRHDGHPRTYNGSEVGPDLIRWLRDSRPWYGDLKLNGSDLSLRDRWDPFLFARKFASDCVEPLLSIAKDIIFKE